MISLTKRHVLVGTAAQFIGRFTSSALVFGATLILARILGSEYFGEYTKITAYLAIFYVVVDLGMNPVFLHLATKRLADLFPAFFTLRLVWGLLLGGVALAGIRLLSYVSGGFTHTTEQGVVVGAVAIVGYAVSVTTTAIFQARRSYDRVAFAQVFGSLMMVGLLVGFYNYIRGAGERGVMWAVVAMVVGTWATALGNLLLVAKYVQQKFWQFNIHLWRTLIRDSLPMGLTLIFNIIYIRTGTLVLAAHRPNPEVGAYGLAYKFFEFAIAPATFFLNSMYPELLTKTRTRLWREIKTITWGLVGVALIITLVMWIGSPLLTLVKSDFAASVRMLRALSLFVPLFFLTSPIIFLAVILKKQFVLVYVYGIAMCLNIGLNLLFIPRFGSAASIAITGVTEIIVALVGWTLLRKNETG